MTDPENSHSQAEAQPRATPPPAIVARGLALSGSEGPVYGPLDLTIPGEGVTIIHGPVGAGRTALLLTLAGRMKPKSGELTRAG